MISVHCREPKRLTSEFADKVTVKIETTPTTLQDRRVE